MVCGLWSLVCSVVFGKVIVLGTFARDVQVEMDQPVSGLAEGVAVEARYQKRPDYFPGTISKDHQNGECDIRYDEDDDVEKRVHSKYVRASELPPKKEMVKIIGLILPSRLMLLFLLSMIKAGMVISIQSDGTYKLHGGGWTLIDAGTHDVAWNEAKWRYAHSFFAFAYVFCKTEWLCVHGTYSNSQAASVDTFRGARR